MSAPVQLITPASLKTALWQTSAHLNYGRLGSVLCKDCTTFPGLSVSDSYDKRARRNSRTFFVAGDKREFATIQDAARAWNDQRRAAGAQREGAPS